MRNVGRRPTKQEAPVQHRTRAALRSVVCEGSNKHSCYLLSTAPEKTLAFFEKINTFEIIKLAKKCLFVQKIADFDQLVLRLLCMQGAPAFAYRSNPTEGFKPYRQATSQPVGQGLV
ncbi:MAG: hypothetical protein WC208_12930 [Gallionella sp.]|jgi:hypothetical protein